MSKLQGCQSQGRSAQLQNARADVAAPAKQRWFLSFTLTRRLSPAVLAPLAPPPQPAHQAAESTTPRRGTARIDARKV